MNPMSRNKRWPALLGMLLIVGACESPAPKPDVEDEEGEGEGGQGGIAWRSSSGGASSASWGTASGYSEAGAGGQVTTGGAGGKTGSGGATGVAGQVSTGGQASAGSPSSSGKTTVTGGASASGGGLGGTGGTAGSSGAAGAGGSSGAAFSWGNAAYDPAGGAGVAKQGHNTGKACLAACHTHTFKFGGTVYQSDGTTTAANAQIGLIINGALVTTYSGSKGNFFGNVSGTDWATAQIAIRTATGTLNMPVNASASGNCNSCHTGSGTKRITQP